MSPNNAPVMYVGMQTTVQGVYISKASIINIIVKLKFCMSILLD